MIRMIYLGWAEWQTSQKKRITGDKVYFVLNRHVNPTNICVLSCKFCDFAKKPGDSDAYEMSIEEILDHVDDDIHEIHIVGGHHPTWPFEYYVEMVKAIHEKAPHVQIKGFTASEIDYFPNGAGKVTPGEIFGNLEGSRSSVDAGWWCRSVFVARSQDFASW
ncbi:MAG: hypothetical protein Ct9H300mP19_06620 [Dehalococcoidia bacterium]|nr:MAG: hypothetical protein Ct9H300mP19_06620 [Dehalococcoidia bacterium]